MKYYKFQFEDMKKWYHELNGRGIFYWDCGLGKTFVSVRTIELLLNKNRIKNFLVVCPVNLKHNWSEYLKEKGIDHVVYHKPKGKMPVTGDRMIINYENLHKINQSKFDLIIADEVHKVKSYGSRRSKAFKILASESKYLLMLSGTLWQGRNGEELINYLWSINDWRIRESFPKCITHFRNEGYSIPIFPDPNNPKMRYYTTTKAGMSYLNSYLKKYVMRRELRKEVGLPQYTEKKVLLNCGVKWEDKVKELQDMINMQLSTNYEKPHIMTALQMANGIDDGELINPEKNEKFKFILEKCEAIGENQMIVWYYWTAFGKALNEYLKSKGVNCDIITGGLSQKKKVEATENFKSGKTQILIASMGTIEEGHNLQNAQYMIFSNVWYDYIKYTQCRARIERLGQKNNMYCWVLVSKKSLEIPAYQMMQEKKSIQEAGTFLETIMLKKFGWKM
jgi:SNF2 family DNA or RNA helicase